MLHYPAEIPKDLVRAQHEAVLLANMLVVETDEQASTATDALSNIKSVLKQFEDARDSWVRPLNGQVKRINDMFREKTDPLKQADSIIRSKVLAFQTDKNAKAAEAERKRREDDALARAIEAEAAGDAVKADAVLTLATHTATPDVRTAGPVGSSGASAVLKKIWTFEIVDREMVPREYLMVDSDKIKYAIRNGERKIPGVRIFQREDLAIR